MRKLLILLLFVTTAAAAQVRTYGEMETKTFVIGLSDYYFGDAGSLSFRDAAGNAVPVTLSAGRVVSAGLELTGLPAGNTLLGAHDFTDDGGPELVVGTRGAGLVKAQVYRLAGGKWTLVGIVGARGDVEEIRVFRQAMTVKDKASGTLYTWTCHGGKFDFKSSSGGADPALGL